MTLRPGRLGRRVRAAASPLLVLAIALAGVAVVGYLRGAYATATALGVAAVLTSAFVVLARD
ncbi:hypothetical protein M0R88_13465 [Halorussus gelatinilyticus]|uniref:Uncharacterized protein n=1 Tax=Halorussus gelatinilyticus TaxID=2937524 RepID=A0A8U0IEX4_9EURY|nr:hypothetical protein [Halorussus gelatinilyticus]UPV99522.1 hypothetical protein M0R88_13465 [Halorussus gelatinilyticus]